MLPVDCHPAQLDDQTLLRQCRQRLSKASGPGGQRRNKVQTAVHLHHEPTGIEAQAAERRSRVENLRVALIRLRVNLALDVRCAIDAEAGPGSLWRSRVKGGRIVLNPGHADFAPMLAQALDALGACDFDAPRAAAWLGCSTTQLVKLLSHQPRALAVLNDHRHRRGQRPYAPAS